MGKKRDIVMKRSNRNMFCVELVAIENAAREPAVFLHSCFFFFRAAKQVVSSVVLLLVPLCIFLPFFYVSFASSFFYGPWFMYSRDSLVEECETGVSECLA